MQKLTHTCSVGQQVGDDNVGGELPEVVCHLAQQQPPCQVDQAHGHKEVAALLLAVPQLQVVLLNNFGWVIDALLFCSAC